jgi:hypothetical protein
MGEPDGIDSFECSQDFGALSRLNIHQHKRFQVSPPAPALKCTSNSELSYSYQEHLSPEKRMDSRPEAAELECPGFRFSFGGPVVFGERLSGFL